ncbi:tyrosine-type recombinase/integrase [Vibrio owensii]|uniref:tyrosine-type recombinase/integrase n=1 Tax=Vibrio harveyi group TaxID=717610 RepID=UPI00084BAEE3|nr:tyrosine-type recombinase/integrase [Vibrio parahaemolyticus]ODX29213.1 recombinase [Vibrio parahaemolyticus]HCG6913766.1 tyrosine-type recombinase/integrase [Vibrio parahaemolyticus]HCG6919323.1 tyrosine-type recombinase/integrase [Vibrio parahaemolyticus]HCH0023905.1 tyrosine-type recombinase/integrase [Vibrio parahaemolyticus]HCH1867516.1 tyrosine-type recombinase/integrase [Vibrio parahaemolyticus]
MLSNQRLSSRKSLYLITSRTGVFAFRWNLRVNGKHHQPTLSLKTRDYLQAVKLASEIAIRIQQITQPTLEDIKSIYSDFKGSQSKKTLLLHSIDISNHLTDLSIKSQTEYRNCWNSFVNSLSQSTTLASVRQSHIDLWKKTQTCSLTTMKKKLRLLSSCFGRVGHKVEQDWFKVAVEKAPVRPKRAITKQELGELLKATQCYKKSKDEWKYYLPRIAALTGCRLNEIAQLRVCDVQLGDEPTLSINDDHDDKKLKNSSSKRVLPVTTLLLNLLSELTAGKGKNEHLFSLPYSKQNGYAGKPSKYFSGLLKSLAIDGVSFHSLRHYAVTELFNAGVKEELIGTLMGHSVGKLTTGKVYLSGFSYQKRLAAMGLLGLHMQR